MTIPDEPFQKGSSMKALSVYPETFVDFFRLLSASVQGSCSGASPKTLRNSCKVRLAVCSYVTDFGRNVSGLTLTLVAVLALPAVAFAQPASGTNAKGPPDAMRFCYINGEPYSEGAKADNRVCVRPHSVEAFNATELPLRWEEAARSK